MGQCLPTFGPQHVSNVMWGFATLGHCPGPQLLDELASHATDLFCFDLQQVFLHAAVPGHWSFAYLVGQGWGVAKRCTWGGSRVMHKLQFMAQHQAQRSQALVAAFASCIDSRVTWMAATAARS